MKRGGPLKRKTPLRRRLLFKKTATGTLVFKKSEFEAFAAAVKDQELSRRPGEMSPPIIPVAIEVLQLATPAFPKLRKIKSPTWCRVVRYMPCAACSRGFSYEKCARLDQPQSECHHWPPRGRSGGGSDLETIPLCPGCHQKVTDGKLDATGVLQELWVVRTQQRVLQMLRTGELPLAFLLVVAEEVQAS